MRAALFACMLPSNGHHRHAIRHIVAAATWVRRQFPGKRKAGRRWNWQESGFGPRRNPVGSTRFYPAPWSPTQASLVHHLLGSPHDVEHTKNVAAFAEIAAECMHINYQSTQSFPPIVWRLWQEKHWQQKWLCELVPYELILLCAVWTGLILGRCYQFLWHPQSSNIGHWFKKIGIWSLQN